jgi:endonuclease/exonuclease/phosphatase (EEP) superfamily protein YafD
MTRRKQRGTRRGALGALRRAWLGAVALATTVVTLAFIGGVFGHVHWRLDLLAHFRVHYSIALALCVLAFALVRAWRAMIASALVLTACAWTVVVWWIPAPAPPEGAPPLSLAHANVFTWNARMDEMIDHLHELGGDILGMQEVRTAWTERIAERGAYDRVAGRYWRMGGGIALFVRREADLEVTDAEVFQLIPEDTINMPAIQATITHDDRPARLLYVHAFSPSISDRERSMARNAQHRAIADWVRAQEHPAIVLGDLNATVFSASLSTMTREGELINSLRGHGPGASWPDVVPDPLRIGIDHCLHDTMLATTRRVRGGFIGSDHAPIRVDLAWR